ncbi:MAG TPA: EAL domain-containing protein [Rhodocyclaceae bacterium]|nr:EAL domain-containing protein [Rhodocyclaceae bacterium]
MAETGNDELQFSGEDDTANAADAKLAGGQNVWRILIVDDDPDVHATTTFALRGIKILHRSLQFLHANSAAETRSLLEHDRDIAVILLDVVMEQDDAGLCLVRDIRECLGMKEVRIILRTGQPGYAPEIDAIRDYDINDYKTKSELTRNKLYTTLTAALRSYDQIRTIEAARDGLSMVVQATHELMALSGMRNFAAGVITQLAALLHVPAEGLICAQRSSTAEFAHSDTLIIAAAGRYAALINQPVTLINDRGIFSILERCLNEKRHIFEPDGTALFFGGRDQQNMAAYLDTCSAIDADTQQMLALFCTNISIGLDNTILFSRLHDYAFYDTLVDLPNRHSFIGALNERLNGPDRTRYTLALIDLDHFAETNDALGHNFGDMLLRAVAQRLKTALDHKCVLARVSGDTFGVLDLTEHVRPAGLASLFREPFVIDGQDLMVSATVGIAHLSDIDGDGGEALKDASMALRRAKTSSRGEYGFFTRDMAVEIRERARLLQALRHAIERQRLFLMYQPQVALADGKICGMEALLRWRTEDGQLIAPARFIPIAEHSGMIVGIGEWVLRMACFHQADLCRQGFEGLRMAVNISVYQMRHPGFLQALKSALEDSGVKADLIELEVTESIGMEEADFVSRTLDDIRALGVKIAVDDFGTGFSSLSYLQRLQIDRLKIDRTFVAEIAMNERARRIPELIIQLGRKLSIAVIAEGVETVQQADVLRELGCTEAQGFFYARPMESTAMSTWLKAYRPPDN